MKKDLLKTISFLLILILLVSLIHGLLMRGWRLRDDGDWGVWNQVMAGEKNADIIFCGSSRVRQHFDSKLIGDMTGKKCLNLGITGAQPMQQLAILKTYLKHNKKPEIIIQGLDLSAMTDGPGNCDPMFCVPYLHEEEMYRVFHKINRSYFYNRYIPLYSFAQYGINSTIPAVKMLFRKPYFWVSQTMYGYCPSAPDMVWRQDSSESRKIRSRVRTYYPVDAEAVNTVKEIIRTAQRNDIDIILVYPPEYYENIALTLNRDEIFDMFRGAAKEFDVEFWDYSDLPMNKNTGYFFISDHLNCKGATLFSRIFAEKLCEYVRQKDVHREASGREG